MNNRTFNIISIILILLWIWADRYMNIGAPAYGWLLLVYVVVLFCGSYFIRMGFFMKSICKAGTTERIIALSFDDGPVAGNTEEILDLLKKEEAQAIFFCTGKNIPDNKQILVRMVTEGHLIGNHSYSHAFFFDLFSAARMQSDMEKMSQLCKEITGFSPRFFRPPYGVTNPNLKKAVLKGGFIPIGWTIRSMDTAIKNEDKLLRKILTLLRPGAILLLHDHPEITLHALTKIIAGIREKGYRIVRLDKMINLNPYA